MNQRWNKQCLSNNWLEVVIRLLLLMWYMFNIEYSVCASYSKQEPHSLDQNGEGNIDDSWNGNPITTWRPIINLMTNLLLFTQIKETRAIIIIVICWPSSSLVFHLVADSLDSFFLTAVIMFDKRVLLWSWVRIIDSRKPGYCV